MTHAEVTEHERLVDEYVYIARHMKVPEYFGTHEEHARHLLEQGTWGLFQLEHSIRTLWGKN